MAKLPPIQLLIDGDEAAWSDAYRTIAELAVRSVSRLRCSEADRRDVTQIVILEMVENLKKGKIRDWTEFKKLIFECGRTSVIDFLRKTEKDREHLAPTTDPPERSDADTELEDTASGDPMIDWEWEDYYETLKLWLFDRLTPQEQELCRDWAKHESVRKIAAAVGVSPSTMQGRIEKLERRILTLKAEYEENERP